METKADLASVAMDFDFLWSKWPARVGKRAARAAWARLGHDERLRVLEALAVLARDFPLDKRTTRV